MPIDIHLKIFNPSPYSDLSLALGKEEFFTYCNEYYDLIMAKGKVTKDDLALIKDKLQIQTEIEHTSVEGSPVNYIIMDCVCETSWPKVYDIIQSNHGIEISPVRYQSGWEFHKFVCISKKDVSKVLKGLRENYEIEIISINESDLFGPMGFHGLSFHEFIQSLTQSQVSLLLDVYRSGYYKIPRTVKLKDIAENLGISRYAVESRLRRGENHIMDLVLPFVGYEIEQSKMKTNNELDM